MPLDDDSSSPEVVSLASPSVSLDGVSVDAPLGGSLSVVALSSFAAGSSASAVFDSAVPPLGVVVPAPDSNREEPARRALASRSSSELPRVARAVRAAGLGTASVVAGTAIVSSPLGFVAGGAAATDSDSTGRAGGTSSLAAGMLDVGTGCGSLGRLAMAAGCSIRACGLDCVVSSCAGGAIGWASMGGI